MPARATLVTVMTVQIRCLRGFSVLGVGGMAGSRPRPDQRLQCAYVAYSAGRRGRGALCRHLQVRSLVRRPFAIARDAGERVVAEVMRVWYIDAMSPRR